MIPYPVIDVTSRPQTLEELSAPLEARRALAREKGELWAVMILTGTTPFHGVSGKCVTALVLNAADDERVAEFTQIAQEQSPAKALRTLEMIGSERDVALAAYRAVLSSDERVVEATVRMIDRIVYAENESSGTGSAQEETPRCRPPADLAAKGAAG